MSDVVAAAVKALQGKVAPGSYRGTARFVIVGEGAVQIDATGVRAADVNEVADVTLTADTDTFRSILAGELKPAAAFMSGRLRVDGDMGAALRLGSALA